MATVAFVQSFWFEFLGPMYLSAYLKQRNHKVDLFLGDSVQRIAAEVVSFQPDVLAFSCSSGNHQWASIVAAEIKKKIEVISVMGGPHATFYPEAIFQENIDYLIRGEGEEALLEFVETLERGEDPTHLQNLTYLVDSRPVNNPVRPLLENLDDLPTPDRQLYYKYAYLKNNPNKHFITGRGCPYNCAFCCNKAFKEMYAHKGKLIRRHSAERVIEDILDLKERYGLSTIRFDDEVFILMPEWLDHFLDLYSQRVQLPFSCLIRADLLTKQMAHNLKKAGCYIAYFGIESGVDELRNDVLKKKVSREDIVATARNLKEVGILTGTFNMLGLPGETVDMAFETIALNQHIKIDYPWCSILQPYPNTELEETALQAGYIEQQGTIDTFSSSYFNRSLIKNEQSAQLENLQRFFYIAVKFPVLHGLIRKLIRFKSNFLFDFIFQITYGYRYIKTYRISFWRLASYAFRMKSHF